MPHRNELLQLLRRYQPSDDHETLMRERIIHFVSTTTDCFQRSHQAGHITCSAWLLSPDRNRVLLTHHKKIGAWLQVGGHADGDTNALAVAKREAEEESGIAGITAVSNSIFDVDIHEIKAHNDDPAHLHYDIRFLLVAPHTDFIISPESNDLRWMPIDVLTDAEQFSESVARMARKTSR